MSKEAIFVKRAITSSLISLYANYLWGRAVKASFQKVLCFYKVRFILEDREAGGDVRTNRTVRNERDGGWGGVGVVLQAEEKIVDFEGGEGELDIINLQSII